MRATHGVALQRSSVIDIVPELRELRVNWFFAPASTLLAPNRHARLKRDLSLGRLLR
jgi:hypothetical protein